MKTIYNEHVIFLPCDCGDSWHTLRLCVFEDLLSVCVTNHPAEYSLRERIKGAWKTLRGVDHVHAEVLINPKEYPALFKYISELIPLAETR